MLSATRARLTTGEYEGQEVWPGGDLSVASALDAAIILAQSLPNATPTVGAKLKTNNSHVGNYDWKVIDGDHTVSSFVSTNYFTTRHNRWAFVVVKGNLTIPNGVTFKPIPKKAAVVIYATGNIVIDGEISMSEKGGIQFHNTKPRLFAGKKSFKFGDSQTEYSASSIYDNPIFGRTDYATTNPATRGSAVPNQYPSTVGVVGGDGSDITAPCRFNDQLLLCCGVGGGGSGRWQNPPASAANIGNYSGQGGESNTYCSGGGGGGFYANGSTHTPPTSAIRSEAGTINAAGTSVSNPNGTAGVYSGGGAGCLFIACATSKEITGSGSVTAVGGSVLLPTVQLNSSSPGGGAGGGSIAFLSTNYTTVTADTSGGTSGNGFNTTAGAKGGKGSIARFKW